MLYIEFKAKINYKTAHPRYLRVSNGVKIRYFKYLGISYAAYGFLRYSVETPTNEVVIVLIDFIRTNDSYG